MPLIAFVALGGCDQLQQAQMNDIHDQVVQQTLGQYRIAKDSGQAMDACVHAGLVAAAYLQAQDQQNYQQWKGTEQIDCAIAGLPK